MTSEDSMTTIKGIGDYTAKLFALVGINTISDLINYYPRAYNYYSNIQKIVDIKPGQVSIKATIHKTSG